MSGIDVRSLVNEKLPAGKFPVDSRADFRLYIAPEVRRGIEQHAKADVSVEICGVLVGNWEIDENGPYAVVTNYIRCENAASKFAEVTFTHESWAQINKEMDSKYADARIVGWYHSHPDFGIFLSERDTFIQEHFFSGAGQVAFVFDPVRNLEGVFAWHDGKPTPLAHYWVGNKVVTADASEREQGGEKARGGPAGGSENAGTSMVAGDNSMTSLLTMALGGLCLLLLGYLYGGWRAHVEEELQREEAIARLADLAPIRTQADIETAEAARRLLSIADIVEQWPELDAKPSEQQAEDIAARREAVQQLVKEGVRDLANIKKLSDAERNIYSRIISLKEELYRMNLAAQELAGKQRAERQAANAKKPAASSDESTPADKNPTAAEKKPDDAPQPSESQQPPASTK